MSNVVNIPNADRRFTPRTVTAPGELAKLCEQYLRHLQVRNLAANTVKAYQADLEQFAGYCISRDVLYVQHVTAQLLEDFAEALINGQGCAPRTAARKRETVKGFLKFAVSRNLLPRNPADDAAPIRFNTTPTIAPETDQLLAVIRAIPGDTLIGIRDRAFFRLLFDGACRVSGICALDVYRPDRPPANTVHDATVTFTNKGGRIETNPIDDITQQYLDAWLAVRHRWAGDNQPALFVNNRGNRITRAGMHDRCKVYGKAAGLPHLHLHLFRHRRTGDVYDTLGARAAQFMAKHKNIETTMNVYGHHADPFMRAQLRDKCKLGE